MFNRIGLGDWHAACSALGWGVTAPLTISQNGFLGLEREGEGGEVSIL